MKKSKVVAWLVTISLSLILVACSTPTPEQGVSLVPAESAPVSESSAQKSSTSGEKDYIIIENEEEPMAKVLVPEDATEVEHIDNGVSLVSATSFEATVEYYKEIIGEYQIDGKEAVVDIEKLGVEECWKFDGTHDDRLFSITVARSESGTVGVAIIY